MIDITSNLPKITHIITGLNVGGAERALYSLLTGGLEGPFQNQVISLLGEGHYGDLLREAGIPVTCLNMKQGIPGPSGFWKLLRTVAREKPDILQGWMYHGNLAAWLARMLASRRSRLCWNVRTSLDSIDDMARSTRFALSAGRALSNHANQIIYNSSRSLAQHEKSGFTHGHSRVIPNGFDLSVWRNGKEARTTARQCLGFGEETRLLGYVGRNNLMKDPENLFAAVQELLRHDHVTKIAIVGRGLQDVAPHFPEGRVHFFGQRNDIPEIMPAFDIFCLSSRTEAFPNVLGEAMACGVPCVTTDVGDAAEIVGDTGWVVPKRDSEALGKSLIDALTRPDGDLKSKGIKAHCRIEKLYSLDIIIEHYRNMYLDILKNGQSEHRNGPIH